MAEMTREDLAAMLRDMAAVVEARDSFEGRIAYTFGSGPDDFEVDAFYRVGNSMGQGGAVFIQPSPQPLPEEVPDA
jgi:hypothetical protein